MFTINLIVGRLVVSVRTEHNNSYADCESEIEIDREGEREREMRQWVASLSLMTLLSPQYF